MSKAAQAEPTPSPSPASEVRAAKATDARAAFAQTFGAAFAKAVDGMDLATHDEIHARYGGDPDREIEDVKAGRHPLQRGGRDLDAYTKYETRLAALRTKLAR